MFFELSLKGKKHCLLFTVHGELSWEPCSKQTCAAGEGHPLHGGDGEREFFFQVLPRALDTAASLPCWKK